MYRAAASDSVLPPTHGEACASAKLVFDSLSVADLKPRHAATITGLTEAGAVGKSTGMAQRLAELGFIVGETVSVLHRGPGGREPIAVQVGDTVFALRRHEASCIRVSMGA
jgi:ferrous iron transport protein A